VAKKITEHIFSAGGYAEVIRAYNFTDVHIPTYISDYGWRLCCAAPIYIAPSRRLPPSGGAFFVFQGKIFQKIFLQKSGETTQKSLRPPTSSEPREIIKFYIRTIDKHNSVC